MKYVRTYQPYLDYFVPRLKYQLVKWLEERYPNRNWWKEKRARLLAIYHSIRQKGG